MKTFKVFWSPEGRCIATVQAKDARAAVRKAPMPYRKFLGEMYAEEVPTQRVVFRIDRTGVDRQVTAVLPDAPANAGCMLCYAHIGQHSECSWDWYYRTRPANSAEYADLLSELKGIYGANPDPIALRVVTRIGRG